LPVIPGVGAVVGEARESAVLDQQEVVLGDVLVFDVGCTEPSNVSGRVSRETLEVRVGFNGILIGAGGDGADLQLPGKRAADELGPFFVDAGDSEVTGEFECGNSLNSGIEVLGGLISIDVGEEARRLDGTPSCANPS